MLKKVRIQNFKSIADETIELGRLNVFIGENGCGKSNLLEAFAYLAGAMSNRLKLSDIESRGVRIARPDMTVGAFEKKITDEFKIDFEIDLEKSRKINIRFYIPKEDRKYIFSDWNSEFSDVDGNSDNVIYIKTILGNNGEMRLNSFLRDLNDSLLNRDEVQSPEQIIITKKITESIGQILREDINKYKNVEDFLGDYAIYQFETSGLRGKGFESHLLPLGIQGEGLDILFTQLSEEEKKLILEKMSFIGWLDEDGILIDTDGKLKRKGLQLSSGDSSLYFKDKFLYSKRNLLSAENANEGVLHLLACITAVVSGYTPRFFAIDNVDGALNPHLCRVLVEVLADLVKPDRQNKQILLTTQNPAILDGINLYDEEERLFAISRDSEGKTRIRRITIKEGWIDNTETRVAHKHKLSEMWMRGSLGAIPKHF